MEIALVDNRVPTEINSDEPVLGQLARQGTGAAPGLVSESNAASSAATTGWRNIAVTPQPAMVGNDQPSDLVGVAGDDQPSTVKIRCGAEEYRQILRERGHVWARWKRVIIAVLEIDTLAMCEAETNAPRGAKFNKAVAKLLRLYELDIIHKADRSRMRKFAGKLELIDAWRSEQSPERQFKLNHPRVVYNAWNHAQGEKQPLKPKGAPDLAAILGTATDDEVKAALCTKDVAWLLRVLPTDWLGELKVKPGSLKRRQARRQSATATAGTGTSKSSEGVALGDALVNAFDEIVKLADECSDTVESLSEHFGDTWRVETLDEIAKVFEDLRKPDVSAALASISVNLPKPRKPRSYGDQRDIALGKIAACVAALKTTIDKNNPLYREACDLCSALENASAEAKRCEFPGERRRSKD